MASEGFNYKGRRYQKAFARGLSHELATEKMYDRRRNYPQYLWAIKKTKDGTYSLGRASRF